MSNPRWILGRRRVVCLSYGRTTKGAISHLSSSFSNEWYNIYMKKGTWKRKPTKVIKRGKLRVAGVSDTAELKREIQHFVRLIVIIRDKGCILRSLRGCNALGSVLDGKVVSDTVLQADHLRPRNHSATYADTRLIVCVCRGCHLWKKYHEQEYNDIVRTLIPKENLILWDRCIRERFTAKKMDWKLELLGLKKELSNLSLLKE